MDTSIIIAPHLRMKRIGSILLTGFFFLALNQFAAQRDDPSEIFLKAYITAQQGERFEHDNQFKTALAKYRFAGSLIEELRKSHADWQPAIVEYRGRKISEAILRIQDKVSTQNDLTTGGNRLPEAVPAFSQGGGQSGAGVEVMTSRATEATPRSPSDATIKETTRNLRDNLDQLQAALEKSQSDLETARKEKELVNARLQQSNSKLEKAQSEIEKSKKAEQQVRDQLAQAQESLKTLQSSRDSNTKEQQRVQALLAENSDLKQKLASAEKSVRTRGEDKPKNTKEFANAKQQVAQLQQQLTETQNQNQYFEARVAELSVQLDDASAQLQSAKLTGANADETAHLAKENELLRNIIVRERQEEARRYEAKNAMLAELDKLKIQSDALNKQIEFLAQPVTKLSDEELALLREPVVSISDQNSGTLKASFIFAKKSSIGSITIAEPDEKEKPPRDTDRATTSNSSDTPAPSDFKSAVPDDLQNVARAAKESFEHGKYRTAESKYQEILAESPNNLYALSNLGVVYFHRGKFKAAEQTLKKALAVSPKDEFVHTTLGIVYYRQAKFDDAVAELTKSLEINPKSPIAHNYLGITASQKGRLGEAEKEILQAIANNPDYADAHFNLAVIFATTQPASKELAKRHYTRATALGTQPDPSLEKLLQ
jgi:Flp pilus assembly protein TadD